MLRYLLLRAQPCVCGRGESQGTGDRDGDTDPAWKGRLTDFCPSLPLVSRAHCCLCLPKGIRELDSGVSACVGCLRNK